MIRNRDIVERLETISPYTEEELLGYELLIEAERLDIEERLKTAGQQYFEKAVLLAAARVNYKIALIRQSSDKVTSFKAGDISITEGNEMLENAKALLDEITSGCAELAGKDGFVFRTV